MGGLVRLIPGFLRDLRRIPDPYDRLRFAQDRLLFHILGGDSRPPFFAVDTTFPGLRRLDENLGVIRQELLDLLGDIRKLPDYHQVDSWQDNISGTSPQPWKVFAFQHVAGPIVANQRRCPRTAALLAQIPHVMTAFFSILTPRKSIPAHTGPTLGRLRYHLGLLVPAANPPEMRVMNKRVAWAEGRSFLFDDSLDHEVFNECDGIRVVLVVDVLRPLPLPFHLLNLFLWRVVFPRSPHFRQVRANLESFRAAPD